jgi:hypothetical protein
VSLQETGEKVDKSVMKVYNYYGIRLEGDDISDMVELMCFRVSFKRRRVERGSATLVYLCRSPAIRRSWMRSGKHD